MECTLIETMFEAINGGDEEVLGRCLERATIETILQFETFYEESPLHLCVKFGGSTIRGLIRRLLASGLVDVYQCDSGGLTVLECALATGDTELVEWLIKMQIDGVDGATACYRMMKHCSLDLFEIFLAVWQKADEAETFQSIASALVKVNVKNIRLPKELRVFLLWKLSDYGYRHLAGDWPGTKDTREWKNQIGIIGDCWRVIRDKYDTGMYGDIDDQLLHRLHTIHNQLYFLKHHKFLAHLPLMELVFCLAVFISIFKNSADFEVYRLMVNKCQMIEYLGMVCQQLELARGYLDETERVLVEIMKTSSSEHTLNDRLLEAWAKVTSLGIPENDNWLVGKRKKFEEWKTANSNEQDVISNQLIKDIDRKVKQLAKSANKADNSVPKQSQTKEDPTKARLMEAIEKQLPHVTHPQNLANNLIAGSKKNKTLDAMVADVIVEESFDLSHLLMSADRRVVQKVQKCYVKTKQLYSLFKIMAHCEQMYTLDPKNIPVFIGSFKRMVQVFGETVKNTRNSPNLPGKVEPVVSDMLSLLFPDINKSLRETFSHSISLSKTLVSENLERRLFVQMLDNMIVVRVMFFLLFVVVVEEARFSLYGMMYRCKTVEQLRSLMVYVGKTESLSNVQSDCFKAVKKYFAEMGQLLAEQKQPAIATESFQYIEKLFSEKNQLVDDLGKVLESEADLGYAQLRKTCFATDDLTTVRRLLDWILTLRCPLRFFDRVRSSWFPSHIELQNVALNDHRLKLLDPAGIADILKFGSAAVRSAENDYIRHTLELARTLGLAKDADDQIVVKLNEKLKQCYYKNMFYLDDKRKLLDDLVKAKKCTKAQVDEVIKTDQARLQKMFDEHRNRLRSVLNENGLSSVESLENWSSLPPSVFVAIEYFQLEITEMLSAVGYFGDSFYYVKHRIPMIQGVNYRNYLAHDGISYNLVSDSSKEKIVINAYVIANTEVRLFDKHSRKKEDTFLHFPTVEDTNRWLAEQDQLMAAFEARDVGMMHEAMMAGGEIKSRFCCSPNPFHHESDYRPLTQLSDPCNPGSGITELFSRYYETFAEESKQPMNVFRMALVRRNFDEAFKIMTQLEVIRQEIYEWPEFVTKVRMTNLFGHFKSAGYKYLALKQLIEHGNERGVREMLPYFANIRSYKTMDPLGDAILCGVRAIVELLLTRTSTPHPKVLQSAIITHAPLKIIGDLLAKRDIGGDCYRGLLATAVRAKNADAVKYFLKHEQYSEHVRTALEKCYELAACTAGQHRTLQFLLENYPLVNPAGLARILHQAARKQRWASVRMLLDSGVPSDVLYSIHHTVEETVLLLLAKYGQSRLLGRLKSVDRAMYGTVTTHPLTVAVRSGMDSKRMVRTLGQLGFHWLDSTAVFHEKLHTYEADALQRTWTDLDQCLLVRSDHDTTDRFAMTLNVLQQWKIIAYVEQIASGKTSLIRALKKTPTAKLLSLRQKENLMEKKKKKKTETNDKKTRKKANETGKVDFEEQANVEDEDIRNKNEDNFMKTNDLNKNIQVEEYPTKIEESMGHKNSGENSIENGNLTEVEHVEEDTSLKTEKMSKKDNNVGQKKHSKENESPQERGNLQKKLNEQHNMNGNNNPNADNGADGTKKAKEKSESEKRRDLVKTLLDRSRAARRIAGIGVLGGIVFQKGSSTVLLGVEHENTSLNVQNCCVNMIVHMERLAKLNCSYWQEFTIDAGVSVTFQVLPTTDEPIELPQDVPSLLTDSGSLLDNLGNLLAISRTMFGECTVVCANMATASGMLYFWQIEETSCVFDVRPEASEVDLTELVNARDDMARTPLHWCLGNPCGTKIEQLVFQYDIWRMLMDEGANPMLADEAGTAPIQWSLAYPTHPDIAVHAIDECVRRDLRGATGETFRELVEGSTLNHLIHTAVLNGRCDIVEKLIGLYEDVNVANVVGFTPAHMAVQVPLHGSVQLMEMLLNYDRTLVDMTDILGRTVLHCAAETNSIELVDLIMAYNPKQGMQLDGKSPFAIASARGFVELAERFSTYVNSGIRAVGKVISALK